jgi:N-methylhydantoinase B
MTERRSRRPWGLAGGGSAASGRNQLRRAGGATEELPGKARILVEAGDVLRVETPGGGGWGAQR